VLSAVQTAAAAHPQI
jgi:RND superfamily putative drug exporter